MAQSIDAGLGILLVLLDLSAAFDTLDDAVLLRRLHGYGICSDAHAWLASYLQGRTSMARVKKEVRGDVKGGHRVLRGVKGCVG